MCGVLVVGVAANKAWGASMQYCRCCCVMVGRGAPVCYTAPYFVMLVGMLHHQESINHLSNGIL